MRINIWPGVQVVIPRNTPCVQCSSLRNFGFLSTHLPTYSICSPFLLTFVLIYLFIYLLVCLLSNLLVDLPTYLPTHNHHDVTTYFQGIRSGDNAVASSWYCHLQNDCKKIYSADVVAAKAR